MHPVDEFREFQRLIEMPIPHLARIYDLMTDAERAIFSGCSLESPLNPFSRHVRASVSKSPSQSGFCPSLASHGSLRRHRKRSSDLIHPSSTSRPPSTGPRSGLLRFVGLYCRVLRPMPQRLMTCAVLALQLRHVGPRF